jgi:uncharacterized protein (TIGR03435 family)
LPGAGSKSIESSNALTDASTPGSASVACTHETILAAYLEGRLDRPVEIAPPHDGLFDFDLEDPPGVSPFVPLNKRQALLPLYLAALEQQLGARAELRTMPVRVLVIEGATKPRAGS